MTTTPQYLREFPDFDHTPELPEGFDDVSWNQDSSPSFQFVETGNILYLNYRDPARREYEAACFVLDDATHDPKGETRTLYVGDDIAEALRICMQPFLEHGEGFDDETGDNFPALGFLHAGTFITNPRASECGRFDVDPVTYYRVTPAQLAVLDADAAERADRKARSLKP